MKATKRTMSAPGAKRASAARKTPVQAARKNGTRATTTRLMRIRSLDPRRACGDGTTVTQLFRVDDLPTAAAATTHLVFFDRHGWYCEHGRDCPAVAAVRKHDKTTLRTR